MKVLRYILYCCEVQCSKARMARFQVTTVPEPCDGGRVASVLDAVVVMVPFCGGDWSDFTCVHIETVMFGVVFNRKSENWTNT